jgi:cytochrome c551/c552
MKHYKHLALGLFAATVLAAALSACAPVTTMPDGHGDPVAAKGMALKDHCLTCHSLAKQKGGPTFKAVAAKYQGNPNAEAELYEHLTTIDAAKMADGHVEYHKCIANETPEKIRNMVRWILEQ